MAIISGDSSTSKDPPELNESEHLILAIVNQNATHWAPKKRIYSSDNNNSSEDDVVDEDDDENVNIIKQNKDSIFQIKKESIGCPQRQNDDTIKINNNGKRELDMEALQKKKLKYETILLAKQIAIAQRESYKLDLELHKLEVSMNKPPSQFTRRFFDPLND